MDLGEQARLELLGNFQFLSGAAFGFEFLSEGATMSFDAAGEFVEADEAEGVSVGIFKARMNSAPGRNLGWKLEVDAAFAPLFVLSREVFGDEVDIGWTADKFSGSLPGMGSAIPNWAVPSGGATSIQRLPSSKVWSTTTRKPSLSAKKRRLRS
jgi:hypothetical protein